MEPNIEDLNTKSTDTINNPFVYKALHDILDLSEIETYRNYEFVEWQLNLEKNQVYALKFLSRDGFITLPCDYMFCYENKQITYDTFSG